jgi:ABC-2 type transport system ATP-binding protein
MKRKLMIARALVHEPRLLILDEPTAGVDVETRQEMWKFMAELNETGTTIILTTHYLEEAEKMCRNVAIIDRGEIIENTSIKHLLSTLESEPYILLTTDGTEQFKPLEGYELKRLDNFALRLELLKDQSIGDVIHLLNEQGIEVKSVRSKSNKLEELFLNLVNKK